MANHRFKSHFINSHGERLAGDNALTEFNMEYFSKTRRLLAYYEGYEPSDEVLRVAMLRMSSEMAIQAMEEDQRTRVYMFPPSSFSRYVC